jgi:glycolate oxidase FAD binding subunit
MTVALSIPDALREIAGRDSLRMGKEIEGYSLGGTIPRAAVSPADESAVSRILALAWEEGLSVVPWGSGAHQSIGHPPVPYDLAVDLRRLNRVVEHEPADMTATAQAGIGMADLQGHLGASGQFLPLDAGMADRATLGGVLATRLSGPLRCRYGTARDLVLGLRVAHADGTITKAGAKVVKNATGYDMTKLYVGSHGTLGIILEATFRVFPRPVAEQGWWLPAPDLGTAQALANRILGSHIVPNRVELLEETAGQACGGSHHGSALLVSVAGVPEAIRAQADDLGRIAGEVGIAPIEVNAPERTWNALSDFPWLPADWNGRGHRAVWRGGVPPADCARAMQAIREAAGPWSEAGMAASVAHGALRGTFRVATCEALVSSLTAAREALAVLGGFLTVLDAPAQVRAKVDVWGPAPDGLTVMRRLKREFDAKGVLNPGRFVGGI